MMMKNLVTIAIVLLISSMFVLADQAYPDIPCDQCQIFFGDLGYCSASNVCYLKEETVVTTPEPVIVPEPAAPDPSPAVEAAPTQLAAVQDPSPVVQAAPAGAAITTPTQNSLETRVTSIESDITSLKQKITNVESNYNNVQKSIDSSKAQQEKVKAELTSVKEDLITSEDEDDSSSLANMIYVILGIALIGGGAYFFFKRQGEEADSRIKSYITNQIKLGRKYVHIKENLLQAGWQESDVENAYKSTMKHNYRNYLRTSPTSRPGKIDKRKVFMISIFSIFVLVGLMLVLKGVTTGKAIHFQTQSELDQQVELRLQSTVANNQFYSLIDWGTVCVEVLDEPNRVSYLVSKTPQGHTIEREESSCSSNPTYDVALQFLNWGTFNTFSNDITCTTARNLHGQGLWILPSRTVLPGFQLNPQVDYTQYCNFLQQCLTNTELAVVGCSGN